MHLFLSVHSWPGKVLRTLPASARRPAAQSAGPEAGRGGRAAGLQSRRGRGRARSRGRSGGARALLPRQPARSSPRAPGAGHGALPGRARRRARARRQPRARPRGGRRGGRRAPRASRGRLGLAGDAGGHVVQRLGVRHPERLRGALRVHAQDLRGRGRGRAGLQDRWAGGARGADPTAARLPAAAQAAPRPRPPLGLLPRQ